MKNWMECVVSPTTSLKEAIARIDRASLQLAIIVDESSRLMGTLSDGDVRRAILRGVSLDDCVSTAMNDTPSSASQDASREALLASMRAKSIHQLPIVDSEGRVIDLATLDDLIGIHDRMNPVVLMAGGLGTRLRPLTDNCPKPMLPIRGKPILERIIESFAAQGFRDFYLSVNYLADKVRDHFEDGVRHGVRIRYIEESMRMGTAGALSLLPAKQSKPVIVMNADLLTEVRFSKVLDFHASCGAAATMVVRQVEFQIPYGVVELDGTRIVGIDEKPVRNLFVNAGIYILSPDALDLIHPNTFFDMPTLFGMLAAQGKTTAAYPIHETWMDIGRVEEFERAKREWDLVAQS